MDFFKQLFLLTVIFGTGPVYGEWVRHTIDQSSRGADGVRVQDINRDGLLDLATGWEEGGQIRVYLNPGPQRVKEVWPARTVGHVKSPEDAVFVDLNGDGTFEVVSSCEGKTRSVYVHWNLDPQGLSKWRTENFPELVDRAQWMFAAPMNVDQRNGVDLVIGAKGPDAEIGWLQGPAQPQKLEDWRWHRLARVGWVMSIETIDMDGDGDLDILYSDRKSQTRGIHWLENNASESGNQAWPRHTIGGTDREVMFLSLGDVNQDGMEDVAVSVKDGPITWFQRTSPNGRSWHQHEIELPPGTGSGKGIAVRDVDLDGLNDLVFTCEHAEGKIGVGWLAGTRNATSRLRNAHDISGTDHGIKFDLIRMLDLDEDGDLDLVTCEERDNLGVIWYENPTR